MRHLSSYCLLASVLALFVGGANADDVDIVKVEETWELTVGEPNTVRNAPQVSMVMSSHPHLGSNYFILLLNHRTDPSYSVGGMQLQLWNGEQLSASKNGPITNELNHAGETITWTQTMSLAGGVVNFSVHDGTSQSWGNFGGAGYLSDSIATGQSNLNDYDPHISISESSIGFAGNRVAALTLQRIRWTLSDGRQFEVVAPINIDTDLDPWTE